jgi:hypothetical protein
MKEHGLYSEDVYHKTQVKFKPKRYSKVGVPKFELSDIFDNFSQNRELKSRKSTNFNIEERKRDKPCSKRKSSKVKTPKKSKSPKNQSRRSKSNKSSDEPIFVSKRIVRRPKPISSSEDVPPSDAFPQPKSSKEVKPKETTTEENPSVNIPRSKPTTRPKEPSTQASIENTQSKEAPLLAEEPSLEHITADPENLYTKV